MLQQAKHSLDWWFKVASLIQPQSWLSSAKLALFANWINLILAVQCTVYSAMYTALWTVNTQIQSRMSLPTCHCRGSFSEWKTIQGELCKICTDSDLENLFVCELWNFGNVDLTKKIRKLRQIWNCNSVNLIFNPQAFFFCFLTGAIWYWYYLQAMKMTFLKLFLIWMFKNPH